MEDDEMTKNKITYVEILTGICFSRDKHKPLQDLGN